MKPHSKFQDSRGLHSNLSQTPCGERGEEIQLRRATKHKVPRNKPSNRLQASRHVRLHQAQLDTTAGCSFSRLTQAESHTASLSLSQAVSPILLLTVSMALVLSSVSWARDQLLPIAWLSVLPGLLPSSSTALGLLVLTLHSIPWLAIPLPLFPAPNLLPVTTLKLTSLNCHTGVLVPHSDLSVNAAFLRGPAHPGGSGTVPDHQCSDPIPFF